MNSYLIKMRASYQREGSFHFIVFDTELNFSAIEKSGNKYIQKHNK